MQIINQSWAWVQKPRFPLETIEAAGRTCYKSEDAITHETAPVFVEKILSRGHESVIEHVSASVRFITNRGVTHELVRHRLAAYSQESTRYVRYDGDMEFIRPVWEDGPGVEHLWMTSMLNAETTYQKLLLMGWPPQQAREVLPNSLKTEIVMTANLREWRHVFRLRAAKAAHPQMRALMIDCLAGFKKEIPVIFDDILPEEE
jgi:thymidylate synthase (FAD)